jgi:hypothetical protein
LEYETVTEESAKDISRIAKNLYVKAKLTVLISFFLQAKPSTGRSPYGKIQWLQLPLHFVTNNCETHSNYKQALTTQDADITVSNYE